MKPSGHVNMNRSCRYLDLKAKAIEKEEEKKKKKKKA